MVWSWTCWGIFCGDDVAVLAGACLGLCCTVIVWFEETEDVAGLSVTITTPVPLHVEHFVTVVTFFFFAAIFAGSAFCRWITFCDSFTSNLMSPSDDTKIWVGLTFCALVSFCMHVSHRINLGPLRFAFCMCPPQLIHFCLSFFCWLWDCCWTKPICSFIVWCSCAGSNDSVATIWIPKFCPLSVIKFCAWIKFGCCVTTVTVSLCESSWLCVLLCWFSSVKCGNIWLHTSHLKLILDIVF